MDGTNRKVLISENIMWPNGLAVDIFGQRNDRYLYWTDANLDKIEKYDVLNGTRTVSTLVQFSLCMLT